MKQSYHACMTSHSEVMFRNEEDHGMFLNLMALEASKTDTELLVDAEMSTHVHIGVLAADPRRFAAGLRMAYTRYMNHKYGRKGRLGEKGTFLSRIDGFNHQLVAFNYIQRNGLHHGAAPTAFGYRYCSAREPFAREIGFVPEQPAYTSRQDIASFLPRHAEFPDGYAMDRNGVFLRRSFMEVKRVEQYYASPRNYLYQMNRLTDDTWKADQMRDRTGAPLTLSDIEHGLDEQTVARLLKNEYGRSFNPGRKSDMEVCMLIDNEMLPGTTSVYQATESQRQRIYRTLRHEFHLGEKQVCRCLGYADVHFDT